MLNLFEELNKMKNFAKGTKMENELLPIYKAQLIYMKLQKNLTHKEIAYILNTNKTVIDNIISRGTKPKEELLFKIETLFFERLCNKITRMRQSQ